MIMGLDSVVRARLRSESGKAGTLEGRPTGSVELKKEAVKPCPLNMSGYRRIVLSVVPSTHC
jgi:hypothetical protein